MLSKDEIADGILFILKLPSATGTPVYWMEKLRGDIAVHWFDIFRESDWETLRAQAANVFQAPVTSAAAEHARLTDRCIVIQPHTMLSTDLMAAHIVH